jgi:hypothetical protein
MKYLKEYNRFNLISENLQYHLDNNISLYENVFRYGSEQFFLVINEARELYNSGYIKLSESDIELIKTDIGLKGIYEGKEVWLDIPMINEAEYKGREVELNKPKRGGSKKFYVYVKDPKTGNVKKVEFGAKGGGQNLAVKIDDPDARKRFDLRHGCSKGRHNDKTKPGYWSCRLPRFSKQLKLGGAGKWW